MLTTLLTTLLLATSIAAIPAEVNSPRRNIFERQLVCQGITTCTTSQKICCGYNCCTIGCDISGLFCSSAPTSTCPLIKQPCGSECCDLSRGYCGSSNRCVYPVTTTSSKTYSYTPLPTPASSPKALSCLATETRCGTTHCCSAKQTCTSTSDGTPICVAINLNPNANTDSNKNKSKPSSNSKATSAATKKIVGIVIGAVVVVAIATGGALYRCCGLGKKKKDVAPAVEAEIVPPPPEFGGPPAYGAAVGDEGKKQMGVDVNPK